MPHNPPSTQIVQPKRALLAKWQALILKGILATFVAGLVLCWCGWRFGFRAGPPGAHALSLPEPHRAPSWESLDASNVWYCLRELKRLHAHPSGLTGGDPGTGPAAADLSKLLREASEATDATRPAGLDVRDVDRVWDLLLTDAGTSATPEDLFQVWKVHARTTASPENADLWDEHVAGRLEGTLLPRWRDRVLASGTNDLPRLLLLLEQANQLEDLLQPLQVSFWIYAQRTVGTCQQFVESDWGRVRNDACDAAVRVGKSALAWVRCLAIGDAFPGRATGPQRSAFAAIAVALQRAAVSEKDARAMERAILHAQLAWCAMPMDGPETGPPPATAAWLSGFDRPAGILRWMDRPAFQRMPSVYPSAAFTRAYRRAWLASWRAAHLTLALKCYQLQHGRWPVSLGELESTIRTRRLPDPNTGRAYGYRLDADGRAWELSVADEPMARPEASRVLLRGTF